MVESKGFTAARAELRFNGGHTWTVNFDRSFGSEELKRAMNEGDVWIAWADDGAPLLVRMADVSLMIPVAADP